jgi:hypothetical protein
VQPSLDCEVKNVKSYRAKLRALDVERPSISWLRNREARWVKPKLSLKVRHLAFGSGLLRHATVKSVVQ